jgi:hypothetical protein
VARYLGFYIAIFHPVQSTFLLLLIISDSVSLTQSPIPPHFPLVAPFWASTSFTLQFLRLYLATISTRPRGFDVKSCGHIEIDTTSRSTSITLSIHTVSPHKTAFLTISQHGTLFLLFSLIPTFNGVSTKFIGFSGFPCHSETFVPLVANSPC